MLPPEPAEVKYLGLHVLVESKKAAEELIGEIPRLVRRGVNLLFVEVDYNYEYQSPRAARVRPGYHRPG